MNIPDKKTDREDNRDARSFLKTRIQAESAGFFNGLLALIVTSAIGVLAGSVISQYISEKHLHYIAGTGFIIIGMGTLIKV